MTEQIFQDKVRDLNGDLNDTQIEKLGVIAKLAYSMIFHGIKQISIEQDKSISVVTENGDCDGFVDLFQHGISYVSDFM